MRQVPEHAAPRPSVSRLCGELLVLVTVACSGRDPDVGANISSVDAAPAESASAEAEVDAAPTPETEDAQTSSTSVDTPEGDAFDTSILDSAPLDTSTAESWYGMEGGSTCQPATCGDGDPCTQDLCALGSGCYHLPAVDGTPCTSTGACATGNTCSGGQCGVASIGISNLGSGWNGHPVPLDDGGFVVGAGEEVPKAGGEMWLARYGADLKQVWKVKWNPSPGDDRIEAVRRVLGGDFIAVGSVSTSSVAGPNPVRPWVARVTADGKPLWQVEVPALDQASCATAVTANDDGVALLARAWSNGPAGVAWVTGQGTVAEATLLGMVKEVQALAMAKSGPASVDVLGYAKTNGSGFSDNRIWRLTQGQGTVSMVKIKVPGWSEAHSLSMANGNAWWLTGWRKSGETVSGYVMAVARVGWDGVTHLQRTFPAMGGRTVRNALTTQDGGLLVMANKWSSAEPPMLLALTPGGGTAWLQTTALTTSRPYDLVATPSGFAWTEIQAIGATETELHLVRADHFGHTTCASAGNCWNVPAATCQDGNPCTYDACAPSGSQPCTTSLAPAVCDDGLACTLDACDPTSGCNWTDAAGPCTDSDACTSGDTCTAGQCAGAKVVCDDGLPCTADACESMMGCKHLAGNDGAACEDGNPCTVGGVCLGGTCGKPSLWQVDLFQGEGRTIAGLWPAEDGGLAIAGDVGGDASQAAARVARVTAFGQVEWQQSSPMQVGLKVHGAARTTQGAIWTVGAVQDDVWLAAWSAAGAPLWVKTLPSPALDSAQAATATAAGVSVCGLDSVTGAWCATFDSGGGQVTKATIAPIGSTAVGAVLAMANGDIVAAVHGVTAPGGGSVPTSTLVRVTGGGTVLWSKTFGQGSGLRVHGMAIAPAGLIAVGTMGFGADFSTSVGLLTVGPDGQAPPTLYGLAGPGGSGHGIAPYGDHWLISLRHADKQPGHDKAIALEATGSGNALKQIPLLADITGRVYVLARPAGWDAAAQRTGIGNPGWRVRRADGAGNGLCP